MDQIVYVDMLTMYINFIQWVLFCLKKKCIFFFFSNMGEAIGALELGVRSHSHIQKVVIYNLANSGKLYLILNSHI